MSPGAHGIAAASLIFALAVPAFAASGGKNDESYRSKVAPTDEPRPRGKKTAGILVTSIGGGIGVVTVLVGSLMNTCAGSYGDNKVECRKNAQDTMNAGVVITAISAAIGVPLIVVGVSDQRQWDREHESGPTPPAELTYEVGVWRSEF